MDTEVVVKTTENYILNGTKNDIPHTHRSTMVTELPSLSNMESKITSELQHVITDGVVNGNNNFDSIDLNNIAGDLKIDEQQLQQQQQKFNVGSYKESKNGFPIKNKRKRRRGKPKQKSQTNPFKKSNWKFQMPRYYRNGGDDSSGGPGGGGGNGNGNGNGGGRGVRNKLTRSRSIVPYNTNKFLMEEHMAELPSAHLTPSGRTRDSSFSVDSEDNYFYSLPEDEEEFLTKEFANVYEKARVERLEGMTKQQLIEECLQLEDRYGQGTGIQQNGMELLNKIRALEERVRELSAENLDLRRKIDYSQGSLTLDQEQMCANTSEDSESDSSSSSRTTSEYSKSRHSSLSYDDNENNINADNVSRMDSDDYDSPYSSNGQIDLENSINENEYNMRNGAEDNFAGTTTNSVQNISGLVTGLGSPGPHSPPGQQRNINTVD